jgi:hypothetical protein
MGCMYVLRIQISLYVCTRMKIDIYMCNLIQLIDYIL